MRSATEKFWVIAAAYNEAKNLPAFFGYWLAQDHPDFEIVIVDDGSADATWEVISSYARTHPGKIRGIRCDRNGGVGKARLMGFHAAEGGFLKFSDTDVAADHPVDPGVLSRLAAPFADPEVDVVYAEYAPLYDDNNAIRSLENFYYYAPVLKAPEDYATRKTPAAHMPTAFRNVTVDLSEIAGIRNGEDRYLATAFLARARKAALAEGSMLLDVNTRTASELFGRYFKYGLNSGGFLKIGYGAFAKHVAKPLVVALSAVAALLALACGDWRYATPAAAIWTGLFALTAAWGKSAYLSKPKKNCRAFAMALCIGPFFLSARYLCEAAGMVRAVLPKPR